MPAVYLMSEGKVVGVCSLAAWNRYRSAVRKAKLRREAAMRAVERRARIGRSAAIRRRKEAQRLELCRHRHVERRQHHAAMLRRRQAKWDRPRRVVDLDSSPLRAGRRV